MLRTLITAATIVAAMLASLHIAAAYAPADSPRVCFPAHKWHAAKAKRPCAQIVRVYEDGSVRLRITSAKGRTLAITKAGVPW